MSQRPVRTSFTVSGGMSEIEDALARVKAYADELDRRYAASEHMLGLGDGAGYYDLIADEIRGVLRGPEVGERS